MESHAFTELKDLTDGLKMLDQKHNNFHNTDYYKASI